MNALTSVKDPMPASLDTSASRPSCACKLRGGKASLAWVLQGLAAAILGQTLFFKFSGADEAVYIFTTLGVEPWGRYFAAVSELVAVLLLLTPRTAVLGAAMSVGIMLGAIASHLGPLGISVKDDGGLLFGMGVVVLIASLGVLAIRREQVRGYLWQARRLIGAA
ncbi:MAG: DoxX family protein [Planctomycetota bacterium]|nr:DoxX family protein [Planctomycetota bacterium]